MPCSDHSHIEPQLRIKQLCTQANDIDVDPNIPIKRYFRSGLEMVRMAKVYQSEGNLEYAFILYMKFMTLFLEKIRDHPEFCSYESVDKKYTNKNVKEILPHAENLKSLLRERYQVEYNAFINQQKELEEQLMKEIRAKEELRRKQEEKNGSHNQNDNIKKQLKDGQYVADECPTSSLNNLTTRDDALGGIVYQTSFLPVDNTRYDSSENLSVDHSSSAQGLPCSPDDLNGCCTQTLSQPTDDDYYRNSALTYPSVPSRELKPGIESTQPAVNRGTKPLSLLITAGKSGTLRNVVVPSQLMSKFMKLAETNTIQNVETCGILAGKLAKDQLLLTHLLVPKQCGNSDSCYTMNEEELFEYQDKLDLITIGWIHTHPTQTAFLSSVDLHTHCGYQMMMPEAIAIVCAPKYNEIGYFTLSPNHGLSYIANCHQKGFHPHPKEPPLFQAADHVTINPSVSVQVIDLRNKK